MSVPGKSKWKFPNQKCAAAGCNNNRRFLAIFVGCAMNLCHQHHAELQEDKPIKLKDFDYNTAQRIISEY